jgi:hypothetical protein
MVWFTKKGSLLLEMTLHCIGTKLSENFAWELGFLYFIRKFSDGIIWFEFTANSNLYRGDHNPQHEIRLIILNFMVFEFRIYNVNHAEKDDV